MSELKAIIKAAEDGTLRFGKKQIASLKKFVSNQQHRHTREEIGRVLNLIQLVPKRPLDPVYLTQSIEWLNDLCFRKDGTFRDTAQVRRLGENEREVLRHPYVIEFKCMSFDLVDYDTREHPDRERANNVYPVFWVGPPTGERGFYFRFVPWQASQDPAETGIFIE